MSRRGQWEYRQVIWEIRRHERDAFTAFFRGISVLLIAVAIVCVLMGIFVEVDDKTWWFAASFASSVLSTSISIFVKR